MAEPTLDDVLTAIAKKADQELRVLANAIQHREKHAFAHTFANAYAYVTLLKNFKNDYDLPGEWPRIIKELWNEMEYLRDLSMAIARGFRA